jgi:hypothetical protein
MSHPVIHIQGVRGFIALLLLGAGLSGAFSAAGPRFYDDDPLWEEPNSQDASGVQPWDIDLAWDMVENLFGNPGDRTADTRAVNINTVDEVPDGAWFTNRLGARAMTAAEVARGANTGSNPTEAAGTIVSAKSDGVTPGFTIRDASGETWFVKLDPPGWPGMATGTEVVVAKLLWALGYHTPEYFIARMPEEGWVIEPGALITPPGANPRPLLQSDIGFLLRQAARNADGTYRVIASRRLPGTPLGGFRFYGTRPDDPNDVFPHEHRRELRGYGTFAAWLNHVDAKSINSLDVLVTENDRAYVRHYLLDFGSTLGSAAVGPRAHWEGHEYLVEPREIGRGILGFGFYRKPWRTKSVIEAPAVGRLDADNREWDPDGWKPRIPNPAFRRARADDRFWAARKLAALTDEMLRAAAATGEFEDAEVEAALVRALAERRDAILRRYLPAINPVVNPALDGAGRLTFANAAVDAGVAPAPAGYRAAWAIFDNATGESRPLGESTGAGLTLEAPVELPSAPGTFLRVEIGASGGVSDAWAQPVVTSFRRTAEGWRLVGLERLP